MTVTPQPYIVNSHGGWSISVQFTDDAGRPVDLTQAGLSPVVEFYQGNIRRTTRCVVDITDAASGSVVALVTQDVAQSTLQPAPTSVLLSAAPAVPYPFRVIAYVIDSRGIASAPQVAAIQPIDWRVSDFASLPAPQPIVAVVGPAGPQGEPGGPGAAGADGNSAPQSTTAAGAIAVHQVIYADDLGALPASSDQGTEAGRIMGIALGAAVLGQSFAYSTGGRLSDPGWNWQIGPIYLGLDGALTQTAPATGFVQEVGRSDGPTAMIVSLQRPTVIDLPPNQSALAGVSYRDTDGGREVVRLAAVEGPSPSRLVGTDPDGWFPPALLRPTSVPGGKLGSGAHLASVPNGCFEDGFDGWAVDTIGTAQAEIDPTTSVVGGFSAYLHCPAVGDAAAVTSGLIAVGEGVPVYVATRAKLRSGACSAALSAIFYDRFKALIASVQVGDRLRLKQDYGEFGDFVLPPPGARYAAISLSNAAAVGAVGAVQVDELMLHRQPVGPTVFQVTAAAHDVLTAVGGSISAFRASFGGDQDISSALWSAINVGGAAPLGGMFYGALSNYLTSLGLVDPDLTARLDAIWAAATSVTPSRPPVPPIPTPVISARTSQITRAVKPLLASKSGSFGAFLGTEIHDPDAVDGSWESVYVDPVAPINGVLYARLLHYLTAPAPGLSQDPDQSARDLAGVWAVAPSFSS